MRKTANEIRARPDEINSRPIVELHYKINKQKIRIIKWKKTKNQKKA